MDDKEKKDAAPVEETTAKEEVKETPKKEAPKEDAPKEAKEESAKTETKEAPGKGAPRDGRGRGPRNDRRGGGRRPGGKGRGRGRGGRGERMKPEYDQKIISIRRVTRVVSGGRRFSFSVSLVAGNKNGKVGVGMGKATDTALAIEKAFKSAKKNMVTLKRTKEKSIPHEVESKYNSSTVFIKPSPGKGIVAGSSVRNVLDLGGVTDVVSKIHTRSKNKINIARATIEALSQVK